jgi:hypothetical protein
MTIDEAIKHCEEVAEENEKTIAYYTIQGDKEWLDECEKDCIECAKEHRQLAEWLKELKAYKDFKERGYVMCRFAVSQDDRQRITKMVLDFNTKDIFDNVVEVNADE